MNQKKHLNAIAALEASKDAEPGSLWRCMYCHTQDCTKCYVPGEYICFHKDNGKTVSEVRAALQSGLDAYHKRKAEKAERRATGCAHHFINDVCELCRKTRDEIAEDKKPSPPAPLIPDPPDTPEVRVIMERIAKDGCGINDPACEDCPFLTDDRCTGPSVSQPLALSWLSRHPAKWDAEKGPYPVLLTYNADENAMGKFIHSPIVPENWTPMTLSEVLPLIFAADRQFHDEAIRRGYTK